MDIIYVLLDTAAVMIEVTMCFIFVTSFIDIEKNVGQAIVKRRLASIITANLLCIVFNYITVPIAVYSVLKGVAYVGLILLAQLFLYRRYYGRIAVMTATYMLFMTLIDYSTVSIMTYLSGTEFRFFQEMTLFRIYGTIISKAFLVVSVVYIQAKLTVLKKLQNSHLFFLLAISSTIQLFAFYMFRNFMQRNQISGSETSMFLLLLLIETLSFYSLNAMTENNEKEKKLGLLNLYNQMLQKSLEEEKSSFELWSGRIHDYKNHVLYMQELLDAKEYGQLDAFMKKECGILKQQSYYIQSGYKGIDAIINSKMMYAQSLNIHIFCNINIPRGLSLDEWAMVTILGNLLDNAICAELSLQERLIEADIHYINGNLYIKITNHKDAEKIDFTTTRKDNPQWHGIGLRNVKREIKMLNGDFQLIQEQDKVIAIVAIFDVT